MAPVPHPRRAEKVCVLDCIFSDARRAVLLNEQLSHHLQETELDDVLATARRQAWKSSRHDGSVLGRQLYELLNGSGGQMRELIQRSYDYGEPLWLYFQVPFALDALLLELLFRQEFLLLKSDTHIIRRVDRNRLRLAEPETHALKLLYQESYAGVRTAHARLCDRVIRATSGYTGGMSFTTRWRILRSLAAFDFVK